MVAGVSLLMLELPNRAINRWRMKGDKYPKGEHTGRKANIAFIRSVYADNRKNDEDNNKCTSSMKEEGETT